MTSPTARPGLLARVLYTFHPTGLCLVAFRRGSAPQYILVSP